MSLDLVKVAETLESLADLVRREFESVTDPVTDPVPDPKIPPGVDPDPARVIELRHATGVLAGDTDVFEIYDSAPAPGTRYDLLCDGVDVANSVAAPATSITAVRLPTDGELHEFTLMPPELPDMPQFEHVTLTVRASGSVETPQQKTGHLIGFGDKVKNFGQVTAADWKQWLGNVGFTQSLEHLSVADDNGQKVLRHRYEPSSTGSDKVIVSSKIAPHRAYRIQYSVFLEPGFEWGSRYQGGKLAFGFGGGTAPSGGKVDPAGFTVRLMWRGGYLGGGKYDGTAKLVVYSYNADRPDDIGQDTQIGEFEIPVGKKFDVVFEIEANSDISKSDGSMTAWIDGKKLLRRDNIAWQTKGGKPVIDTLYYSSFYGGGSPEWSASRTTYARISNVGFAPVIDGECDIEPETPVFPEPEPEPGPIARTITLATLESHRAQIRFGFDTNRPGRLQYHQHGSDDIPVMTAAENTHNWGAEGREHNQWINGLSAGTRYIIQAMTTHDGGESWAVVDGMSLDITTPEDDAGTDPDPETDPKPPPVVVPGDTITWVSASGSNSNDGQTEARPLRSIQTAIDRANAGDTVLIMAGNYGRQTAHSRRAGANSAPIRVMGYTRTPGDLKPDADFDHNSKPDHSIFPVLDGNDRTIAQDLTAVRIAHGRNEWSGFQATDFTHGAVISDRVADSSLDMFYCHDIGDIDYAKTGIGYKGSGLINNGHRCVMRHVGVINATGQGTSMNSNAVDSIIEHGAIYSTEGLEALDPDPAFDHNPAHNQGTDYSLLFVGSTNCIQRHMKVGRRDGMGHGLHGPRFQGDATGCLYEDIETWCVRGGCATAKKSGPGNIARGFVVHGKDMDGNARHGAGLGIYHHADGGGIHYEDFDMEGVYNVFVFGSNSPGSTFKNIRARNVTSHVFGMAGHYGPGLLTDTVIEGLVVDGAPSLFYYWGPITTDASVRLVKPKLTGIGRVFQSTGQDKGHGMKVEGGSINLPEGFPNWSEGTPDEKEEPDAAATLRVIEQIEWDGVDSVKIMFGFDRNRFGRLAYRRSDQISYQQTPADTTGNWGAQGREHNQWIRGLSPGTYTVLAQTSDNGGDTWYSVGDALEVVIPSANSKADPASDQYLPDMRDSGSLKSVMLDGWNWGSNTADRVTVIDGELIQKFVPTISGSYHDQGAAHITSEFREYTVEQSVRFAADFDAVIIGKFGFGFGAGVTADNRLTSGGVDDAGSCTARLFWRASSTPGMISIGLYSYDANRTRQADSKGKRYGDEHTVGDISLGDWHDTRMVIGFNSSADTADGYMRFYINGVRVFSKEGVQWMGKGVPGSGMQLLYTAMFGGSGSQYAPRTSQTMRIAKPVVKWRNP